MEHEIFESDKSFLHDMLIVIVSGINVEFKANRKVLCCGLKLILIIFFLDDNFLSKFINNLCHKPFIFLRNEEF